MTSKLVGACTAMALAMGSVSTGVADDADVLREARDRAEIEALMWRYVRALDKLDADAYVAAYTADGQFVVGPSPTQGHAALRKMITDMRQAREQGTSPALYHMIANSHIEFVGEDRALFHSYWFTVQASPDLATPQDVEAAGHGVDELVRVDGRWLIKSRNIAAED